MQNVMFRFQQKALLGKWIWRFASEPDTCWKRLMCFKYGKEDLGWSSKKAHGPYGIGLWKDILIEFSWVRVHWKFSIGNGSRVRFWKDPWCGFAVLSVSFPSLYEIAVNKMATVAEVWD